MLSLRSLIGEQIKALNNSPLRGDSQSVQNMKEFSTKIFLRSLLFTILENLGAVSRVGRNDATKVFKNGLKSPFVPTLTGPFLNGQANAGS